MAKFPIVEATQTLPGRAPGVRARLDVSTGGVGRAISAAGEVISATGERKKRTRQAIELKRQQMTDAISFVQAQELRENATLEFNTFKIDNPQETWEAFRLKQAERVEQEIATLPFSDEQRAIQQAKSKLYSSTETKKALRDATLQLRIDLTDELGKALTAAFRSGNPEAIAGAVAQYTANGANMGKDKVEVLNDIKAAQEAGGELRTEDAIGDVHAALEVASDPTGAGDFTIAQELAKNPLIPEPQQTTLRNAIRAAESVRANTIKEGQQGIIDKVTSDTLREYFNEELSVATLNQRHEQGLIKDSEFKFMMKSLTQAVPESSDAFAAGNVRRAMVDFGIGAIDRAEADRAVMENYPKLDSGDRSTVVADLEDVEAKIISAARSNAYSEGRGLMSQRFVGIKSEEDFIDWLRVSGLSEEEKGRINRRWTAEVGNRDLYERAVDERFKEMRVEKVSDVDRYKAESLKILLQYQRRTRLELEGLEAEVAREQEVIISKAPAMKPTKKPKPVNEMTRDEKLQELEKIRELRRLAQ